MNLLLTGRKDYFGAVAAPISRFVGCESPTSLAAESSACRHSTPDPKTHRTRNKL